MKQVIVKNEINELQKLYDEAKAMAAEHNVPENVLNDLYLCIDEVFSNIVNHAYEESEKGKQDIEAQFTFEENPRRVKIAFIDKGKAFNPLEASEPDVSLDLLEREIGGLGIFIVSNLMTSVEYSRLDNKNRLEITKDIDA